MWNDTQVKQCTHGNICVMYSRVYTEDSGLNTSFSKIRLIPVSKYIIALHTYMRYSSGILNKICFGKLFVFVI
jgi:hypothetical protein